MEIKSIQNPRRVKRLFLLVGIILLGFFFRVYQLNHFALRGDEAFTVIHWVREPLSQTLENIATTDPQPPLAYAIYRAWGLVVGDNELTIRFLPALLNTIGIAAMYSLGKRIHGVSLGLLVAFLWALHPHEIYHAQDARSYALWAAATPLALWLGLRALEKQKLRDWVLFIGASLIAGYLYYLELFPIVALNIFVFIRYGIQKRDVRLLKQWVISQVILAIGLGLWFFQERLLSGGGYGGTAGGFDITELITRFVPTLTFGAEISPQMQTGVIVFSLVLLSLGGWSFYKQRSPYTPLLILLGTLPLLFISIVSLRLQVFVPRYVMSITVSYVILMASGILLFAKANAQYLRIVGGIIFVLVILVDGIILSNYYYLRDYAKSPNWRELGQHLSAITTSNTAIINTSADEAFTFYFDQYEVQGNLYRLPAGPNQTAKEIEAELMFLSQNYGEIIVVASTPPDWANRGVVESWLNTHTLSAFQSTVYGLRADTYLVENQLEAQFHPEGQGAFINPITNQPIVTLTGVDLVMDTHIQHELYITAHWNLDTEMPEPVKVFVHVLGDTNPNSGTSLWAQDDQMLLHQSGSWLTNYRINLAELPAGEYQITIGLYDELTQVRYLIHEDDHWEITSFTID